MVQGIAPMDAVDCLSRFREELKIWERKYELNRGWEELFAPPHQTYPELEKRKKNIKIASQLFNQYVDVIITINEWKLMPRASVSTNLDKMSSLMESYEDRCKKLVLMNS